MRRARSILLLAGAAPLGAALGCQCEKEKPYTPFHIEPSAEAIAPEKAAPSASAMPDFTARPSTPAPPESSEWTLEGLSLGVDRSRAFEQAVAADLDGDGATDAVAWTRARVEPKDAATTGELVFFSRTTPAGKVIAKIPPFVPAGPGCHHTVLLSQTGPRTVTLDVAARCDAALVPRSPTRGLAVIAPASDRPAVLVLRLADPAPSETTTYAVDSRDRDGDGRDDVRLTVSLATEGEAPPATADLAWLDRAAGPSRDASEPAKSLSSVGSMESVRAPGKNTSRLVPGRVANARRLFSTLCAESGTPRLFDADGAPLPCGDVGAALSELLVAETRAALAQKDAIAAVAALSREGWYPGPLAARAKTQLEKELSTLAPSRAARATVLETVPKARAGLPRWSPLTFEPTGALLVQHADGIVRVRMPSLAPEDATEGVDAWPISVGGGAEPRWTGVAFPCDRSEVLLLESSPTGEPLPSRPTRLLAPRPGPCGRGTTPAPNLVPVEWTSARTVGLVDGAVFGVTSLAELGASVQRGSPRSPDGKTLVTPYARGLLVANGPKFETWSTWPHGGLGDCVVANGATAAACIENDRAVVFLPEPSAKPR